MQTIPGGTGNARETGFDAPSAFVDEKVYRHPQGGDSPKAVGVGLPENQGG